MTEAVAVSVAVAVSLEDFCDPEKLAVAGGTP